MKEMLKSKSIILFVIIMVLGIVITPSAQLEVDKVDNEYLTYNMQ